MLAEAYWAADRREQALAAYERTRRLAEWNAFSAGPYAAALWHSGERARAEAIIETFRGAPIQLWGLTTYYLQTGNIDAAADGFARMVEQRDPFAVIYAWARITKPLREHPRWPAIAAAMRLETI